MKFGNASTKAAFPGKPLRGGSPSRSAYVYLLPMLIGLGVFTAGPVVASLLLSFTHYEIGSTRPAFAGLGNYEALFGSELFWKVLGNTFYYVVLYVPLSVASSLGLALLVSGTGSRRIGGRFRGAHPAAKRLSAAGSAAQHWFSTIVRTVYFLPVVTSTVAGAIIFGWLYNSDVGLLNYLLSRLGIAGPRWLEDPHWALPAIALMSVWKNAGYNMMIFLAGLANIPRDYYDAARLDGASSSRRFVRITLPLLSPILFFVVVMTTISAFQVFEQTYVMTQGGPANSTLTLSFYIWQEAYEFFQLGTAGALAYVLFALVLVVTLVQFQVRKRWVFQE